MGNSLLKNGVSNYDLGSLMTADFPFPVALFEAASLNHHHMHILFLFSGVTGEWHMDLLNNQVSSHVKLSEKTFWPCLGNL